MKKMFAFGIILIGLLLVLPDQVQSQNRDKNVNVVRATPQDYKSLQKTKEITGIIATADGRSLTFRIGTGVQPIPGKAKVAQMYKEYEFDLDSAVVVKKMFMTPDYDDKGNFTIDAAKTKELRSKGFIAAKAGDIKSGNVAKLVLIPAKQGEKVEGVGNIARPSVRTVVLLQQGDAVEPIKTEKKKKN